VLLLLLLLLVVVVVVARQPSQKLRLQPQAVLREGGVVAHVPVRVVVVVVAVPARPAEHQVVQEAAQVAQSLPDAAPVQQQARVGAWGGRVRVRGRRERGEGRGRRGKRGREGENGRAEEACRWA
jgi:hypothetical protein